MKADNSEEEAEEDEEEELAGVHVSTTAAVLSL